MPSQESTPPAALPAEELSDVRGIRAGAVTFAGIATANASNYAFNFIAARVLGPKSFADVATLTTLMGLIGLPLAAVQFVVARDVARLAIAEGKGAVAAYSGRALTMLAAIGGLGTLVFLAAVPVLASTLDIRSHTAVVLTALLTSALFVAPVLLGAAQGLQRFTVMAAAIAVGPVVRVPLLALVLGAGWGVAGAMAVTLVSSVLGVVIPLAVLRSDSISFHRRARLPTRSRLREMAPVFVGVLAITGLTTDDVIVAKLALSNHSAGIYSGASLIGRVLLYLPGAVVTVLLPKVAARAATNRKTEDILESSLLVTGAFCLAGVLVYAAVGSTIVKIVFGGEYDAGAGLLWLFGIAMTAYAILNVVLTYTLGHRQTLSAWLLGGGLVLQSVLYVFFHGSRQELVVVSITVAGVLLVAHEILVIPFIRDGLKRLGRVQTT